MIMKRILLTLLLACMLPLLAQAGEPYRKFLKPYCEWCGNPDSGRNVLGFKRSLEIAHEKPQAKFPELKAVESNCFTLCRNCHWVLNHGGESWQYAVEGLGRLIAEFGYVARHGKPPEKKGS